MNITLDTVASKHGFSTAKDLLGALELALLDESPVVHATPEALTDALDILAPKRSFSLEDASNLMPRLNSTRGIETSLALWAINAAFRVLQ